MFYLLEVVGNGRLHIVCEGQFRIHIIYGVVIGNVLVLTLGARCQANVVPRVRVNRNFL
jgi:hypothetical protein